MGHYLTVLHILEAAVLQHLQILLQITVLRQVPADGHKMVLAAADQHHIIGIQGTQCLQRGLAVRQLYPDLPQNLLLPVVYRSLQGLCIFRLGPGHGLRYLPVQLLLGI